jgi:hypothetical protein
VSHVRVSVTLPVPVTRVWDELADISSHVEWMADAESITFTSPSTSGVGTAFDCVTKVGPIRLTDRMEITEWSPGEAMGVRHVGIVTGAGRFVLAPEGTSRTRMTWEESLSLPWWLGGPVAAMVLRVIWQRNLRRFRARF